MEFFKLKENKTDVKTEVLAGITTFMTMAYILIVNPNILSVAGMDAGGVFTATALSAVIATVAMALMANYPFALAPGMGLNAFFAFTVVGIMGKSWEFAITCILAEGIIFIILTFLNVREAIFNAIPTTIKYSVSAGIGLFIAFIGLQNAGIIVSEGATLVKLGDMMLAPAVLAMVGVIITVIMLKKGVKGALLFGVLGTYVLGIVAELIGWYVPDMVTTFPLLPSKLASLPPSLAPVFWKFVPFSELFADFDSILTFIIVTFTFLFVDLFDTLGTLMGVASKTDYLDKDGKLPRIKQALLADAIGTTMGAILGTSTVTTYVESSAGVAEGGRTGLTALTTAACFALALVFSPIFLAIPGFATTPALVIVGVFMIDGITKIDFGDITESLPAFLTMAMMPLAYSISEGLIFGIISYVIVKAFTGKAKEITWMMYGLAFVFILKLIVGSPTFAVLMGW
ncbi:MAG TPA: NCS2 family permease [Epulopiscium sp.]|nr:NCS2 family permease [Candidatus Epulonipiscium sp.]